jgi:copper chaperone CopZ
MHSTIVHEIPGRLRVRLPALRRNEANAARITAALRSLDGVSGVEASTVTGSLVVTYDRDTLQSRTILRRLAHAGFHVGHSDAARNSSVSTSAVSRVGETAAKMVIGTLVEKAVERSALALIGAIL